MSKFTSAVRAIGEATNKPNATSVREDYLRARDAYARLNIDNDSET